MEDSDQPDNDFLRELYSANPRTHRTFEVPDDFPYVIHIDNVPPVLFFDAEHIDKISPSIPKYMRTILSFAAYGHDANHNLRPYLHMYVDTSRDEYPSIYSYPNFKGVHYAYQSMIRKHTARYPDATFGFPKPSDIEGHVNTARLQQTLIQYFQHAKIWIGWGTKNDQRALESVAGMGFQRRHNVRFFDLQQIAFDCLSEEGCAYDHNGRRHVLSLRDAASRFLKEEDVGQDHHSACSDALAVARLFDVLIKHPELQWFRKMISRVLGGGLT